MKRVKLDDQELKQLMEKGAMQNPSEEMSENIMHRIMLSKTHNIKAIQPVEPSSKVAQIIGIVLLLSIVSLILNAILSGNPITWSFSEMRFLQGFNAGNIAALASVMFAGMLWLFIALHRKVNTFFQ
ncbi:hypothetical protein QQ008_20145 [Fulvivirgaceae bacterium BMA10]|uniref:Uncharacterized protein n=1 Tax=Splendidivirga corallicola TaxID=3051826 RepID=A0ABT8KSH0_9BACT|nr:hypothetical protein [Fulvivirgaceae bacterium BMA10]